MTRNVVRVAEALVRLRRQDGPFIHLDIEPEPDCVLENTDESLAFFEQWLFPVGAPMLADALGVSADEARRHLQDHITLCFDCCHFAVEYEDPAAALERLQAAGIRIGRVQLSSALHVTFPADAREAAAVAGRLAAIRRHDLPPSGSRAADGGLRRYPDLDVALEKRGRRRRPSGGFTFTCRSSRASTTCSSRRRTTCGSVLALAVQAPFTTPPRDRDLHLGRAAARAQDGSSASRSPARYEWVLQTMAGRRRSAPH